MSAASLSGRSAILVDDSSELAPPSRNFTAEMWFRPRPVFTPPTGSCLLGAAEFPRPNGGRESSGWFLAPGRSKFRKGNEPAGSALGRGRQPRAAKRTSLLNSDWHHLARNQSGGANGSQGLRIWLDGKGCCNRTAIWLSRRIRRYRDRRPVALFQRIGRTGRVRPSGFPLKCVIPPSFLPDGIGRGRRHGLPARFFLCPLPIALRTCAAATAGTTGGRVLVDANGPLGSPVPNSWPHSPRNHG